MFEPIHGSAPKYAGKGVASPVGAIGAVALMLEYLGQSDASRAIEDAIRGGLQSGMIKGVEAGTQRTEEVANIIGMAVAG
jgi:isocitrate/isopropylmalate dehydrogenase